MASAAAATSRAAVRAVQVLAPGPASEVLRVREVLLPPLKPTEVRIQVAAFGINPVETYIRSGNYRAVPALPFTPGGDAAGIVIEVGEEARAKFKEGDRVFTVRTSTGSYAEEANAPAASTFKLPPSLSPSEGAALGTPYFTAHRTLFDKLRVPRKGAAAASKKPVLLVHGATGGVGQALIQLGVHAGLRVIGTAGKEESLPALLSLGCEGALLHASKAVANAAGAGGSAAPSSASAADSAFAAWKAQLLGLASGPINYIAECRADLNLGWDCKVIGPGGSICIVGSRGEVTINPRDLMSAPEASITAVMLFAAGEEALAAAAEDLSAAAADGAVKPVLGTVFLGLESAAAAQDQVVPPAEGVQRAVAGEGKVLVGGAGPAAAAGLGKVIVRLREE